MPMTREQIFEAAKTLDPTDREILVEELWQTLGPRAQAETDAAWAKEAERRIELLDSGQMNSVPADEVLAKLQAKIKK
jgi:putative addiction module component (TIGR02574 family)